MFLVCGTLWDGGTLWIACHGWGRWEAGELLRKSTKGCGGYRPAAIYERFLPSWGDPWRAKTFFSPSFPAHAWMLECKLVAVVKSRCSSEPSKQQVSLNVTPHLASYTLDPTTDESVHPASRAHTDTPTSGGTVRWHNPLLNKTCVRGPEWWL